jgi:hypothetical protein
VRISTLTVPSKETTRLDLPGTTPTKISVETSRDITTYEVGVNAYSPTHIKVFARGIMVTFPDRYLLIPTEAILALQIYGVAPTIA